MLKVILHVEGRWMVEVLHSPFTFLNTKSFIVVNYIHRPVIITLFYDFIDQSTSKCLLTYLSQCDKWRGRIDNIITVYFWYINQEWQPTFSCWTVKQPEKPKQGYIKECTPLLSDKCTYCKSFFIKAFAKCPKCKCKCKCYHNLLIRDFHSLHYFTLGSKVKLGYLSKELQAHLHWLPEKVKLLGQYSIMASSSSDKCTYC